MLIKGEAIPLTDFSERKFILGSLHFTIKKYGSK